MIYNKNLNNNTAIAAAYIYRQTKR